MEVKQNAVTNIAFPSGRGESNRNQFRVYYIKARMYLEIEIVIREATSTAPAILWCPVSVITFNYNKTSECVREANKQNALSNSLYY